MFRVETSFQCKYIPYEAGYFPGISTFAFLKTTEDYTKNQQISRLTTIENPANLQSHTPIAV